MSTESVLRVDDDGPVRLLTLDRPEAKNAFSPELYTGVAYALRDAAADDSVSVVVVTGAPGAFSAGQDLKSFHRFRTEPWTAHTFPVFATALSVFDKPLIAAVNGVAVGVGATMLLHSDVVFVADSARFKFPFVALDFAPEAGSSLLLAQRIGHQAAHHYLLTGEWISSEEAVSLGLALRRCPDDAVLKEAMEYARTMGAARMGALRQTKRLLLAAQADLLAAALQRESEALADITRRLRAERDAAGR